MNSAFYFGIEQGCSHTSLFQVSSSWFTCHPVLPQRNGWSEPYHPMLLQLNRQLEPYQPQKVLADGWSWLIHPPAPLRYGWHQNRHGMPSALTFERRTAFNMPPMVLFARWTDLS